MKAVFLADAHLKNAEDDSYRNLIRFLDQLPAADRLFIAGDFFDFWFCRDTRVYPGFRQIIEKLMEVKKRGTTIIMCEGNHDFFMEDYFSKNFGITVVAEWASVEMDDRKMLVAHGDLVDQSNRKYLFLRKLLRSRFFYHFQRQIPLKLLWKIARISSKMSKGLSQESENKLVKKMKAFALEKFQEGYDAVILGHCHEPFFEEYVVDGRKKTFATLGDWLRHHSYLYYEDGRFSLHSYPATHVREDR